MSLPDAIPAATVILFRQRPGGPEILMVERSRALAFAGGALVFPGGRVEPGDHRLAAALATPDPDETAHRIAAIRETLEETGIAIGLAPPAGPDTVAAIRMALAGGGELGRVLAEIGARIDPAPLVPFARWRPAHRVARIFDTRFYLAELPEDAPAPQVDGTENVRLLWTSAADALAAHARGQVRLLFPTRRNLERIARFADFADAVADAGRYPVATIVPQIERRDGTDHLCIPDGLGYPRTAEPLALAERH